MASLILVYMVNFAIGVGLFCAVVFALAKAAMSPIDKKLDRVLVLLEHAAEHDEVARRAASQTFEE